MKKWLIALPIAGVLIAWIGSNPTRAGNDVGGVLDALIGWFGAAGQFLGGIF